MRFEPSRSSDRSSKCARRGSAIRLVARRTGRTVAAAAAVVATLQVAPGGPVAAASNHIAGVGAFNAVDGVTCPNVLPGHEDFDDYDPIALTGSLRSCWYTKVDEKTDLGQPSGVYHEEGREIFHGSLNGGPIGTFTTTYKFEAKFDANGAELKGRCQHPITLSSGTGAFAGITGRLDFKDVVTDIPPTYVYRGHISLP